MTPSEERREKRRRDLAKARVTRESSRETDSETTVQFVTDGWRDSSWQERGRESGFYGLLFFLSVPVYRLRSQERERES